MIVVESGILILDVHRLVVFGNIRHARYCIAFFINPAMTVQFLSAQRRKSGISRSPRSPEETISCSEVSSSIGIEAGPPCAARNPAPDAHRIGGGHGRVRGQLRAHGDARRDWLLLVVRVRRRDGVRGVGSRDGCGGRGALHRGTLVFLESASKPAAMTVTRTSSP